MMNKIFIYLDELFPDAKCELDYNKDYELLIAIVLSAQTTDKKVNRVTKVLFSKYKTLDELCDANIEDIELIIKEIGTFRKKAVYVKNIANSIKKIGGVVPNDRVYLESLSGVGRKTCNVFLSIIYNEQTIAVDTHVSRVSKRLGLVDFDDEVDVIEKKLMKIIPKYRWSRTHHQLVLFGRYKCKAVKPDCLDCKLKDICKKM